MFTITQIACLYYCMLESYESNAIIDASPHLSLEGFAASECQHENREKEINLHLTQVYLRGSESEGWNSSSAIYLKRKTEKKGSKPPPQHR